MKQRETTMSIRNAKLVFALTGVLLACSAGATTYTDNFKSGTASLQWIALDDACLTAGTQTGISSQSNPVIPSCAAKGITVGADEKIDKQGALLLTPPANQQTGAILSAFPHFPL
jgi:type IV pilus assembly protein PilY1